MGEERTWVLEASAGPGSGENNPGNYWGAGEEGPGLLVPTLGVDEKGNGLAWASLASTSSV